MASFCTVYSKFEQIMTAQRTHGLIHLSCCCQCFRGLNQLIADVLVHK